MGQAEIIKILEKNEKWITAEQIGNLLKVENKTLIRRALKVLYKYHEILRERCKISKHFKYVYKAR